MKHQKKKNMQLFPTKLTKNMKQYQSFLRQKNVELVKQAKITTKQSNSKESPEDADEI